jgi:hypothetical protein
MPPVMVLSARAIVRGKPEEVDLRRYEPHRRKPRVCGVHGRYHIASTPGSYRHAGRVRTGAHGMPNNLLPFEWDMEGDRMCARTVWLFRTQGVATRLLVRQVDKIKINNGQQREGVRYRGTSLREYRSTSVSNRGRAGSSGEAGHSPLVYDISPHHADVAATAWVRLTLAVGSAETTLLADDTTVGDDATRIVQ